MWNLAFFHHHFFNGYVHLEARGELSSIKIGENTHINNNFVAIAEHTAISIGERCLIGTCVELYDSDFHGIEVSERSKWEFENAEPVIMEDDVFIGSNSKIMKGVKIGAVSVIADGSIVTGEVPPGVVAGGNPARIIKVNFE